MQLYLVNGEKGDHILHPPYQRPRCCLSTFFVPPAGHRLDAFAADLRPNMNVLVFTTVRHYLIRQWFCFSQARLHCVPEKLTTGDKLNRSLRNWVHLAHSVQDPPHFHPGLPQPSHPASHRHSSASLFCYATSLQTYCQEELRRPCFSLLRSCCLEFTNC